MSLDELFLAMPRAVLTRASSLQVLTAQPLVLVASDSVEAPFGGAQPLKVGRVDGQQKIGCSFHNPFSDTFHQTKGEGFVADVKTPGIGRVLQKG